MRHHSTTPILWRLARLVGDLAIAIGAFWGAFTVRIHLPLPWTVGLLPAERIAYFYADGWAVAAAQLGALYLFGFYDAPVSGSVTERARRLIAAVGLSGLGLAGYFFLAERDVARSVLLLYLVIDLGLLLLWRGLAGRAYQLPRRRVAIVGIGPEARELAAKLGANTLHGLEIAGYVAAPGDDPEGVDVLPGALLCSLDELPDLLAAGEIDDIILAASARTWQTRLLDRLTRSRPAHSNVLLLPGPVESLIGRMRYRWVEDLPLIEVIRQSEWRIHRPVKRLMDLVGASALLLLAAPLMILVAGLVFIASPGPVLYRQERVGRGRTSFVLRKFRTMHLDAEQDGVEVLARPGDDRLIGPGPWLRALRLDELPQLFNVLGGSMSLVGPRPERPGFVKRYLEEVPGYGERFAVLPGLTGLAQINGEYDSSADNKLRFDLAYIANWGPLFDLAILLRTIKIILTSRGI